MSFTRAITKFDPVTRFVQTHDPIDKAIYGYLGPKTPPVSPGVPNPNDAANAAQNLTDQMRMRRGLMANIFAGASNAQPVTGKTLLGT